MKSTEQNGFTEAWERSSPFLADALARGGSAFALDDVRKDIEDEVAIFYPIENGAAVFRVARYPQRKLFRIWLFGGATGTGRANLEAVMEAADFHADLYECDGIEVTGRKGWEKVLKPFGYEYKEVTLVKELPGSGVTEGESHG